MQNAHPVSLWHWRLQTILLLAKAKSLTVAGKEDLQQKVFRDVDSERWLWCNTEATRRFAAIRDILPTLPDEQTQLRFTGSAGDLALGQAFETYTLLNELAAKHGRPINAGSRVLDFGCGWGRILRFFMKDVPARNLTGIDVMPLAVKLAKNTNPWCNFEMTTALPPSQFADNSFDFVYLYSVFSHLSEEAHRLWLGEFRRIMKPGAVLVATTWPRGYIEACERARNGDTRGTHPGSLLAFADTRAFLDQYDRGEFCHSPVGGGEALPGSFYGETCIPAEYVKKSWSEWFGFREFLSGESRPQNVIVVQK